VIVVDQILQGLRLRLISQAAVGLRRPDHHQLHRDGPRRGLRDAEPAGPSFLDGIGNGLGYSMVLMASSASSASCSAAASCSAFEMLQTGQRRRLVRQAQRPDAAAARRPSS
jgi:Na+-transporting NADH:ubiquinone oxidoreductase subunit NqrD